MSVAVVILLLAVPSISYFYRPDILDREVMWIAVLVGWLVFFLIGKMLYCVVLSFSGANKA